MPDDSRSRTSSVSPSASEAVGRKAKALPAFTLVDGVPLIVGARFGASATVIANGASAVLVLPSLTLMTMFEYVPTFAAVGVPDNCPVTLLNVAHVGPVLNAEAERVVVRVGGGRPEAVRLARSHGSRGRAADRGRAVRRARNRDRERRERLRSYCHRSRGSECSRTCRRSPPSACRSAVRSRC